MEKGELEKLYQEAYKRLKEAKNVLVVGHISPDTDALSSVAVILELAVSLGIKARGFASQKALDVYRYIPHEDKILSEEPSNLLAFDLIVILDCGAMSRTGLERRLRPIIEAAKQGVISKRPFLIEFDHHEHLESYCDIEIRLPEKASTTEVLHGFLKANGLEANKVMASCILYGLASDTGNFLHDNSSSEVLSISSEMLLRGASFQGVVNNLVANKSFLSLKVWGLALESIYYQPESGLIVAALTRKSLAGIVPTPDDFPEISDISGDIVSFLASLDGVRAAMILREDHHGVKGSLRTNDPEIDVAKIANLWRGGGHKKAAGFFVPGYLERKDDGHWVVIKKKA
jgi:phosphoesterase RecJ-like protein